MSSRQPNMANMAQRNTQQGAAHQQQNQPFMAQNGNALQFNNLQQQQLFAQFMASLRSFNSL
ncbi:hypothetical protein FOCG_05683 [Fusarium oxysporum f. sp. radicis-lycopersici 26381]|nr:hypothetical protein FOWG_03936 [Fusarium oxysporum f. sp. lycopersici MN25]EXL54917.1 hypothetical protein FOCG_05683 [Fusarium oxysporum f. sp. radicis-lycopersici 26381]